jgi:adenylate cyclase
MKVLGLTLHPIQILPAAPAVSALAQLFGVTPANGAVTQVLALALIVVLYKMIKGHSLSFAMQTAAGIAPYRQVEALKSYIPAPMREQIESGNFDFNQSKELPDAVIGFVDIVGSTYISNRVSPACDFEFKKEFLRAAGARAKQFRVVILNHTGDGFLFLMDSAKGPAWTHDLMGFYLALTSDFKTILHQTNLRSGQQVASGLRFGISRGAVMVGCLGANPAHFTAVGAQVNLAARLCAAADSDEIVFSERAWEPMKSLFAAMSKKFASHKMKGFTCPVAAVHLRRNQVLAHGDLSQAGTAK